MFRATVRPQPVGPLMFVALRHVTLVLGIAAVIAATAPPVVATTIIASDSASNNPPYSSNFFVGLDGGSGFQTWTSSSSGEGSKGSYLGATAVGSTSFGIFSNGGGNGFNVYRKFDNPLGLGETFSVTFDATGVASGGSVGLQFYVSGIERGSFYFNGGGSNWGWNDGAGGIATSLGFDIVQFSITRSGTNTYTLDLVGSTTQSLTGTFTSGGNPVSTAITEVGFFSFQQGSGENFGFNNLQVVPEPRSMLITTAGLAGVAALIRRRSGC
jgi:hypothetical protein